MRISEIENCGRTAEIAVLANKVANLPLQSPFVRLLAALSSGPCSMWDLRRMARRCPVWIERELKPLKNLVTKRRKILSLAVGSPRMDFKLDPEAVDRIQSVLRDKHHTVYEKTITQTELDDFCRQRMDLWARFAGLSPTLGVHLNFVIPLLCWSSPRTREEIVAAITQAGFAFSKYKYTHCLKRLRKGSWLLKLRDDGRYCLHKPSRAVLGLAWKRMNLEEREAILKVVPNTQIILGS